MQSALVVGIVAVLCIIVAIGAGLQGRFTFSGPRWIPGVATLPPPKVVATPLHGSTAAPKAIPTSPGIVFSWLPIAIVLGCLLTAVLALIVLYVLRHRRRPGEKSGLAIGADFEMTDEVSGVAPDADLPTLQRGLLRARSALEEAREPRDAIVKAWIGLQEAAEDSGLRRRPSETPTEFTSRVFQSVDADRSAAAALLRVYLRARFGSAPATQSDVVLARDAIERLRESWPVTSPQ
jgi:Domain of unknown function (DUF4129)